jgi:DNA-binding LacI/PurR family transcriptional regulator
MAELRYRLNAAGHSTSFASKSLTGLKHDPRKVGSMMKKHPHDACILVAASRSVLEMALKAQQPCFGLFGQIHGLAIAGTGASKTSALKQAIDCLYRNGHRKIVMLFQPETYQQGLNQIQLSFLAELKKRNLSSSAYNLPEWDSTAEGLRRCLESLFQLTPPTAIIIDDWMLQYAIQNFLGHQRGVDYRRVTCISTDYHPCYKWCDPGISHFYWDPLAVVRRVTRWVDHVAKGQDDLVQKVITAKFVEGAGLAL